MDCKKSGIVWTGIFLVLLCLGVVSSDSCNVVPISSCTSDKIVLQLSSESNAHGQLWNIAPTYDYVLCCDFSGDHACTGTNEILGFSSSANAHAEIPELNNYSSKACFGDLICTSLDSTCNSEYNIPMLSLYLTTNSHLSNFTNFLYNKKICCKHTQVIIPPSGTFLIWKNPINGQAYSNGEIVPAVIDGENSNIAFFLNNSLLPQGTNVDFNIYIKSCSIFGCSEKTIGRTIRGIVDAKGNVEEKWIVSQEDVDAISNADFNEPFYVKALGNESLNSIKINLLRPMICESIASCLSYNQAECVYDPCGVAVQTAEAADSSLICGNVRQDPNGCNSQSDCSCQWDSVLGECTSVTLDKKDAGCPAGVDFTTGGSCSRNLDSADTCEDDGFLTYSWSGLYTWDAGNNYPLKGNGIGWIQDPLGTWRYDPFNKSISCRNSGSTTIACPAQIQLSFFSIYNLIFAIVIIAIIYVLINYRKKQSRRKK